LIGLQQLIQLRGLIRLLREGRALRRQKAAEREGDEHSPPPKREKLFHCGFLHAEIFAVPAA